MQPNKINPSVPSNINRTALVITPKKEFFNWLNTVDEGNPVAFPDMEAEVYLLPDFMEQREIDAWVKKHFDFFFTDFLFKWFTHEDLWVKNRTYQLFNLWFDYTTHTMVYDVVDMPIDFME
jgi:hypothetical protein